MAPLGDRARRVLEALDAVDEEDEDGATRGVEEPAAERRGGVWLGELQVAGEGPEVQAVVAAGLETLLGAVVLEALTVDVGVERQHRQAEDEAHEAVDGADNGQWWVALGAGAQDRPGAEGKRTGEPAGGSVAAGRLGEGKHGQPLGPVEGPLTRSAVDGSPGKEPAPVALSVGAGGEPRQ